MQQQSARHRPHRLSVAILAAIAIVVVAGLFGSLASAQTSKRVVKEAHAGGHTVLTNKAGLTLYSLSVEKHGHFICTGSCVSTWIPLLVRPGVKPTGPVALGTVKRPNGKRQVTFAGRPLYTFDGDSRKGEANGEGFKDVGTWHAATP
jgi:predicted lipoprotein with Yx(FWY)xxD motif